MAQQIALPANMPYPEYRYTASETTDAYIHRIEAYEAELAKLALAQPSADPKLCGQIVKFQVADGYARYMVWSVKPLRLMHMLDWDAYSIPPAHVRGLKIDDIRQLVRREQAMKEMFSKKG